MRADRLKYTANLIGLAVLAFLAAGRAFSGILSLLSSFQMPDSAAAGAASFSPLSLAVFGFLFQAAALVLPVFLLKKGQAFSAAAPFISFAPPKKGSAVGCFFLFLGFIPLANMLGGLLESIQRALTNASPAAVQPLPEEGLLLALAFFSACVLPAFLEEILFRGCIQPMLLPYGGWFAVGVTSFLFALLHAKPAQLPSIFLMSLFLGYTAEASGSLRVPILLHFLNNATAFFIRWITFALDDASALVFIAVLFSGYLVAGLFGLWFLRRHPLQKLPKSTQESRLTRAERLLTAPVFMVGVAVAFFMTFLGWGGGV